MTTCVKRRLDESVNIKRQLLVSKTIQPGQRSTQLSAEIFIKHAPVTLAYKMAGKEVIYELVKEISGPQVASWVVESGYDRVQDLLTMGTDQLTEIFKREKEITELEKALKEGNE